MKKVGLTILLTAGFTITYGQRNQQIVWPYNPVTERYDFSESVYVMNANAKHLFGTAVQYLQTYFSSPQDSVIQFDERARKFSVDASFLINVDQLGDKGKGKVRYTLSVSCINNLYKYSLTNFQHLAANSDGATGGNLENEVAYSGGANFPKHYWEQVKERSFYNIQNKIEQLKEYMQKHAAGDPVLQ